MDKLRSIGKKRFFASLFDGISSAFASVSAGLMIVCACILIVDIGTRYLGRPIIWGSDVISYVLVIFVFLSMSEGLRNDAHISADILVSQMNARMQQLIKSFGLMVGFVSTGILAYYSFQWAMQSIRKGDTTYGAVRIQLWPAKLVVAISLILLALMALRKLVPELTKVCRNEASADFGKGLNNPWIVLPVVIFLIAGSCVLLKASPMTGIMLLLITLLFAGVPIGFSVLLTAICCMFFHFSGLRSLSTLPAMAFDFVSRYTLLALPMFVFAGNIMTKGGLGEDLFAFANAFVGHIRGGLGIAVAIACTIFGAISGSSPACALTIGSVAYPIMVASGYDQGMAAGLIATAGGIGILIPPSNAAITYGLVTGAPIGTLFIAGVVPGLLMAAVLAVTTVFLGRKKNVKTLQKATWEERLRITRKSIWALLMPIVVLGGIYSGIVTITEASAVSAVYAVVYSLFARTMNLKQMWKILTTSVHDVAFLLLILITSNMLTKCITMLQLPNKLLAVLGNTPGWVFILIMMIFCIFLGCFLTGASITALTVPVIAPILLAYGYNLVWYGTLLTVNTTLAAITPPVGLNLFIMQRIGGLDIKTIGKGAMPYFAAICILIFFIAVFPELSLWLPAHMR